MICYPVSVQIAVPVPGVGESSETGEQTLTNTTLQLSPGNTTVVIPGTSPQVSRPFPSLSFIYRPYPYQLSCVLAWGVGN